MKSVNCLPENVGYGILRCKEHGGMMQEPTDRCDKTTELPNSPAEDRLVQSIAEQVIASWDKLQYPNDASKLWDVIRDGVRIAQRAEQHRAEQPKHAPEVHALSSETGRGMDAALYGSIALAKKHPEAFRDLEEFMANNGIRTLAIGSMRVERGPDTFDRGEACFHGKVFIESNLSMGPCPKCEKNAEQASDDTTAERIRKFVDLTSTRHYIGMRAIFDHDTRMPRLEQVPAIAIADLLAELDK